MKKLVYKKYKKRLLLPLLCLFLKDISGTIYMLWLHSLVCDRDVLE